MKIKELAKNGRNYSEFNREERNYAAIFFAALCYGNNLEKFLELCKVNSPIVKDESGIYFEYSYLRDLWFSIGMKEKEDETIEEEKVRIDKANNDKKEIIRNKLKIKDIDNILNKPVKDINEKFGVGGEPSDKYIQYPGKWAISKFSENVKDRDDFIKVCKFKWSFNIKPDIVIHLSKDRAICIEAKYDSGEGSYPSSDKDINIFNSRGVEKVGQTELQAYMMKDLLDLEIDEKKDFFALVKKGMNSKTHINIQWSEAFKNMETGWMPEFAKQMIKNTSKE